MEQSPKLPEVATKAPPVGRAAPCQSNDWLGALNRPLKIQSLMCKHSLAFRPRMIEVNKASPEHDENTHRILQVYSASLPKVAQIFSTIKTQGVPCINKSKQSIARVRLPCTSIRSFSQTCGSGNRGANPIVAQATIRIGQLILDTSDSIVFPCAGSSA